MPEISRLTADDAEAAARLHAACLSEAWSAASFREMLAQPGVEGWKIALDGEMQAFVLMRHVGDEAELLTLVVAQNSRRQGMGAALLERAIDRACAHHGVRRIFLEMRRSNEAAKALYAAAEFQETGRRKDYYPLSAGREDAVILQRTFPDRTPP